MAQCEGHISVKSYSHSYLRHCYVHMHGIFKYPQSLGEIINLYQDQVPIFVIKICMD